MDPIDVHVPTSHTGQWLDQSKQVDCVCGPSLYTFSISFFNKNPFLPLLWNLKQTMCFCNSCLRANLTKAYTRKCKPEHYWLPSSEQTQKRRQEIHNDCYFLLMPFILDICQKLLYLQSLKFLKSQNHFGDFLLLWVLDYSMCTQLTDKWKNNKILVMLA